MDDIESMEILDSDAQGEVSDGDIECIVVKSKRKSSRKRKATQRWMPEKVSPKKIRTKKATKGSPKVDTFFDIDKLDDIRSEPPADIFDDTVTKADVYHPGDVYELVPIFDYVPTPSAKPSVDNSPEDAKPDENADDYDVGQFDTAETIESQVDDDESFGAPPKLQPMVQSVATNKKSPTKAEFSTSEYQSTKKSKQPQDSTNMEVITIQYHPTNGSQDEIAEFGIIQSTNGSQGEEDDNDINEWTDSVILRFIDEYRSRRVLWDSKHPFYKSQVRKRNAWDEISGLIRIGVPELKRKMSCLLASYRKVFKKARQVREETGREYNVTWFAYEKFRFLRGKYKPEIKGKVRILKYYMNDYYLTTMRLSVG